MKKVKLILTALLSFTVCGSAGFANELARGHAALRAACLETAHRYFVALDARDAEGFAALFTDDAKLVLPRRSMSGKEEIRGYLEAPTGGRRTFHHLTTSQIDVVGDGAAKGTIYVLLNLTIEANDASGQTQTALISGTYHDEYAIDGGVCRIKDRKLEVAIVNPVPNQP